MKKILVLLLSVVMTCCLFACSNSKEENSVEVEVPEFEVEVCGTKVTNKELADCSLVKEIAESTNSQGNSKTVEYVGYKLVDVFKVCNLQVENAVTVTATDGYSFSYEGDLNDEKVLLAITKDGEVFKNGPWFAPCSSTTTGDYLQDLKSIEFTGTEGDSSKEEKDESVELAEPEVQDKTGKIEFTPYSFKVNGEEVTNDILKDLNIYRAKVTVQNSKGKISEVTYSGYVLKEVLKQMGYENPSSVKAIANDGYEAEVDPEDLASDITLVAIEKDKATSEDGSVWLAPCSQTTSGKYASGVIEIIVE